MTHGPVQVFVISYPIRTLTLIHGWYILVSEWFWILQSQLIILSSSPTFKSHSYAGVSRHACNMHVALQSNRIHDILYVSHRSHPVRMHCSSGMIARSWICFSTMVYVLPDANYTTSSTSWKRGTCPHVWTPVRTLCPLFYDHALAVDAGDSNWFR